MVDPSDPAQPDARDRALHKLRDFIAGLEPDERAVMAAVLAPAAIASTDPTGRWRPSRIASTIDLRDD